MKRIYYRYELWEDYHNGMYEDGNSPDLVLRAMRLLSSVRSLIKAMRYVAFRWVCAAEMNLSNANRNRQAWLGQAACSYAHKVPENLTKEAWRRLPQSVRDRANRIADLVIMEWEILHDAGFQKPLNSYLVS